MKTTSSKSVVSDLILACFILSLFMLLENNKESKDPKSSIESSSELNIQTVPDSLRILRTGEYISSVLE